jgi:hypothetical protein
VRRKANWLEASSQPELAAAGPKDAGARRSATGRGCAARSAGRAGPLWWDARAGGGEG